MKSKKLLTYTLAVSLVFAGGATTALASNASTAKQPLTIEMGKNAVNVRKEAKVKKNASDVKALKKIIAAQKKAGAKVSSDLDSNQYKWDKKTKRLIGIVWDNCGLSGSISFSGLNELKDLYCQNNELTKLDVSKNTKLTILHCDDNKLTKLDVDKNVKLINLYCDNNKLTKLDVSKNVKLNDLSCDNNKLTKLDVSKNTKLTYLHCADNKFTKLEVSNNIDLILLSCTNNKLTSLDLSTNKKLSASKVSVDDNVEVTYYED